MKIEVESDYPGKSELIILGDVKTVLEGNFEKQSLIDTRINYLNTVADYQNSISDLARALGED